MAGVSQRRRWLASSPKPGQTPAMAHSTRLLAFLMVLGLAAPCAAQGGSGEDEESETEGGLDSPSSEGGEDEGEPQTVEEAVEEAALEEEEAPPGPSTAVLGDLSLGVVGVGFEYLIEGAVALHLAAQFHAPWYRREAGYYGVGGELRVFWFFAASGYEGAYLSPGMRMSYLTHDSDEGFREGYSLSGRMSLGYGWIFDSFYLRIGIGGQYEMADLTEIDGQTTQDFGSPYLVLDIYLGWVG